jgi:excisionase family DNA binding protein
MSKLTTKEFSEKVGLTYGRINQLIHDGEIKAEKIGPIYVIEEKYVSIILNRPEKRGRKPKNKNAKGEIAA